MSESDQERKRRLSRENKRKQKALGIRNLSREEREELQERKRIASERIALIRRNLSQEEIEKRRKLDRERYAERLAQLSPEEIEERRRIAREKIALIRRNLSQEEIEKRRKLDTERYAERLAQLSPEKIEERRRIAREKIALIRRNLSQEEIEKRRKLDTERYAERLAQLSPEEIEERRRIAREKIALIRRNLSQEEIENRRKIARERSALRRRNSLIRHYENRGQKAMTHSVQPSLPPGTQMQVQHHLQVAAPLPASSQPSPRQVQMVAIPVQVEVIKPKTVEKHEPREKRSLAISSHQRDIMSSLASLWKRGKLCDAGISNGSSTVRVHKLVLSALCPKFISVFNVDTMSNEFLQVNFPETVSKEALNAFAEYMYNGILDLDWDILEQLKIIAKRLDMEEFEQLCDSHLPNQTHQSASAGASFTNVPLNQKSMPIPASLSSTISSSMQSVPTQIIKQEITDAELGQIEKESAVMFGQESELASLAPNKSGHPSGFVISPIIKTEMVGPEDDKYGYWSSNQIFTSTNSSSSSNTATVTASTSIASVPASSTEFAIPFSEVTDVKSTRLKASHSYEGPLISDLSPASGIVKTVHSQSSSMNKDSSKPSRSSVDGPSTSTSDEVYSIGLFTAGGDNLPLSATTQTVDGKTIDMYKTDLT